MDTILVSIHCVTYNHEKYIADAIESFIMQKTDFEFEILIYDDASTDRTPEIIRKYENLYPNLIKPIYQSENQKSKGKVVHLFNYERAIGKYIASCEGDDYWTDPYKLQKQVDFMEQHPDCSLCVHSATVVNSADKKEISKIRPHIGDKYFSVDEVIVGGGGLFATNSMMFPTKFALMRPNFFNYSPVNDYPTMINLSLLGNVYYMDEVMSSYRTNVSGSWTDHMNSSKDFQIKIYQKLNNMLLELNRYTEEKYNTSINTIINNNLFNILLLQKKYKEIKTGEFKERYKKLNKKRKVIIFLQQYFPRTLDFLLKIKRKWRLWKLR